MSEAGMADDQAEVVRFVEAYLEDVTDVIEVDSLLAALTGALKAKRRAIEDDAWSVVERLAEQLGKGSVADWFAERGLVPPRQVSAPAGKRKPRRSRNYEDSWCWLNPITGAASLAKGRPPVWAQKLMDKGYRRDQLRRKKRDLPNGTGQAFWFHPEELWYEKITRPLPRPEIKALLDGGKYELRDVTRPPGAWPDDRGYAEPGKVPPPLATPIPEPGDRPEPGGRPEGEDSPGGEDSSGDD